MTERSRSDRPATGDEPDAAEADPINDEIVAIVDAVDVPIVVVGVDCALLRFNRAATHTLDLAPVYVGRRLSTLAAFADVPDIDARCAQVIVDDASCRLDIQSGDRRFVLRVAPYAIGTGQTAGAVLTFTNVTAFRESIEQAIYEREYTKAILNTVTNPLVVLGADLCVQSGNRAFYSMFGVSREKTQGVALQRLGDDDWRKSPLWAALDALTFDGIDFKPLELERDFPDFGRRVIELDARRVAGDANARILLAVQDITERKRAEEALQTADRRKDEFIALLAHELRNPLAPIRTGLELIRLGGDTPESVARVRSIMERQIDQMVRLIDDLLDVSRITSGKITLQRTQTSVAELVHAAVDAHRAAITESQIEFSVDVPPATGAIYVDPIRFVQILSNVLHNAMKFTPPHGTIECRVETLVAETPRVAIAISDSGAGISQDMLARVFEMFVQGEAGTERSRGGLGIGLALARRLVEMHGGNIVARSDGPGRGSTFTITMPVGPPVDARPTVPQPPMPRDTRRRVVIVDDNRDAAETISMLVQDLGGTTRIAHDAQSGLDAVRAFQPDVVFLDIGMPGIDGYEVCRRIRRYGARNAIVIVAVTGWGQSRDKQRALEAGFDAHLTKPVDSEAVARILGRDNPVIEAPTG